jgi:hypothetical protein
VWAVVFACELVCACGARPGACVYIGDRCAWSASMCTQTCANVYSLNQIQRQRQTYTQTHSFTRMRTFTHEDQTVSAAAISARGVIKGSYEAKTVAWKIQWYLRTDSPTAKMVLRLGMR